MGFFDQRVNALPSVLEAICAVLVDTGGGPIPTEKVLMAVSPRTLLTSEEKKWPPKGVEETLRLMVDLCLLVETDSDVSLGPEAQDLLLANGPAVRTVLRRRLFAEENNSELWGSNQQARDLTRALAWYLLQDLETAPGSWAGDDGAEERQLQQFGSNKIFGTGTQWTPFVRWATYLGLAVADKWGTRDVLIPDCAEAVEEELGAILGAKAKTVSLEATLGTLAERCPVVDRGTYRSVVSKEARESVLGGEPKNQVSSTLSHALLLLQDREVLTLDNPGDGSDALTLVAPTGSVIKSKVVWAGISQKEPSQ